jgi:hypothetical protein
MPGDFRCDRGDYARVLFSFVREAAGASSARHSLRPLLLGAANQFLQNSGTSRREIADVRRHCEERLVRRSSTSEGGSDEAIHSSSFRDGPKDQTSDVQLRIGESRDSGLDASHRPGMTESGLLRGACHRARVRATRWLAMTT